MLTVELNLVKKNRVYFECRNKKGYSVKLKIDELSKNLELGEHTLLVNDCSVRSKYGTSVIYSLVSSCAEKSAGVITLEHEYNINLIKKCRELGGRFDRDTSVWVFSEIVQDKVEELDELYNSDRVLVEITAKYALFFYQAPAEFLGYVLARAFGRDSGAKIGDYPLIAGRAISGGSVKNWGTELTEGTKFRLSVSKMLLANYLSKEEKAQDFTVEELIRTSGTAAI